MSVAPTTLGRKPSAINCKRSRALRPPVLAAIRTQVFNAVVPPIPREKSWTFAPPLPLVIATGLSGAGAPPAPLHAVLAEY